MIENNKEAMCNIPFRILVFTYFSYEVVQVLKQRYLGRFAVMKKIM